MKSTYIENLKYQIPCEIKHIEVGHLSQHQEPKVFLTSPQNDMHAGVGINNTAHFVDLERICRLLEGFLHLATPERAQVTAPFSGATIAELGGKVGEGSSRVDHLDVSWKEGVLVKSYRALHRQQDRQTDRQRYRQLNKSTHRRGYQSPPP